MNTQQTSYLATNKTTRTTQYLKAELMAQLSESHEHPCFILAPAFCGQDELLGDYLRTRQQHTCLTSYEVTEKGWNETPGVHTKGQDASTEVRSASYAKKQLEASVLGSPAPTTAGGEENKEPYSPNTSLCIATVHIVQWLEDEICAQVSRKIDTLIEEGKQVIVLCSVHNDRFETLQGNRLVITAQELKQAGYLTPSLYTENLKCFMREFLPLEVRLAAMLSAVLGHVSLEHLQQLGYPTSSDIPELLASLNPLFAPTPGSLGIQAEPVVIEELSSELAQVLIEHVEDRGLLVSVAAIASRITALSMVVLEREMLEASHQLLTVAEALITKETERAKTALLGSRITSLQGNAVHRAPTVTGGSTQGQHFKVSTDAPPHRQVQQYGAALSARESAHIQRAPEPLYLQLFGKLEVFLGAHALSNGFLSRTKVRRLLAFLAFNQNKVVSRDNIIEYLWPYLELERAQKNLYTSWCMLAKGLGAERVRDCPYIRHNGEVYQLNPELVICDAHLFESTARSILFGTFDRSSLSENLLLLETSYCSSLVADIPTDTFISSKKEYYCSLMIDCLLFATRQLREAGELEQALYYARTAYALDETREDVYRELMDTQYIAGQRTSAMQTYFSCKRYLADELGILPSKSTTALYQDVLLDSCR